MSSKEVNTIVDLIEAIEAETKRENSIAEILNEKKIPKIIRTIYIDKDISETLDRLRKKGKKGVISKIINIAIRQYLTEQGELK